MPTSLIKKGLIYSLAQGVARLSPCDARRLLVFDRRARPRYGLLVVSHIWYKLSTRASRASPRPWLLVCPTEALPGCRHACARLARMGAFRHASGLRKGVGDRPARLPRRLRPGRR